MIAVSLLLTPLSSKNALLVAPPAARCYGRIVSDRRRRWRLGLSPSCVEDVGHVARDDERGQRTALLWLSPNRLRLRDNIALNRAAELGPDGLAICLDAWPWQLNDDSPPTSRRRRPYDTMTPSDAFGYAAALSLKDSLGRMGQHLWFVKRACSERHEDDSISVMARALINLRPSYIIVDTSLLDRHHNRASRLFEELRRIESKVDRGNVTATMTTVVEVMDDGLLIPFNATNALGRSRRGGRALRWSTFLSNMLSTNNNDKNERRYGIKPTWTVSSLPPPMRVMNELAALHNFISDMPPIESLPTWSRRLLSSWGKISEDEAIQRASCNNQTGVDITTTGTYELENSPLSEEQSPRDVKLSPYLRWGVISPQRSVEAGGVRMRDILWRDWSYICYGLLGPLRRSEPVLGHMDDALRATVDVVRRGNGYDDEEAAFRYWCVGNTGSQLVDAGMHQLWAEGWVPRRVRLLAAACLVEGLGVDWRQGRDWFRHTLIDHDPAINELMWQNTMVGVDPFYCGIQWEAPPQTLSDKSYVKRWMNEKVTWPSHLEPYTTGRVLPSLKVLQNAESNRKAFRESGLYKAANAISKSGVRVAWPGLGETGSTVDAGEVIGVGLVRVPEHKV